MDILRIDKSDSHIAGELWVFSDKKDYLFDCKTLELPWKENTRKISCIPAGKYVVVPRESKKFGKHLHIKKVPDRSYILIHAGNTTKDTSGCVLVGKKHTIYAGEMFLEKSRIVLRQLLKIIDNNEITLNIKE